MRMEGPKYLLSFNPYQQKKNGVDSRRFENLLSCRVITVCKMLKGMLTVPF